MVNSGEMLIGQYRGKASLKGRVAFPKKFRAKLGDKLVITRGYEGCLIIVSQGEWRTLTEGTEGKPFVFEAARDTMRFLLGNAAEVDLDPQGRFVLPPHLREYAEVGEEVVFLGLKRYVEVWDKKRWEDYQNYLNKNIKYISEKLNHEQR